MHTVSSVCSFYFAWWPYISTKLKVDYTIPVPYRHIDFLSMQTLSIMWSHARSSNQALHLYLIFSGNEDCHTLFPTRNWLFLYFLLYLCNIQCKFMIYLRNITCIVQKSGFLNVYLLTGNVTLQHWNFQMKENEDRLADYLITLLQ